MGKVVQYCEVCGVPSTDTQVCRNKKIDMILCRKHNEQYRRNGMFLKRSRYDKNEYRYVDDYIEFDLYNKRCEVIATGKLSLDDEWILKKYKLFVNQYNKNHYIALKVNGSDIRLHRFIINPPNDMVIDHINNDGLDNRKTNLRICRFNENLFNKTLYKNSTSGIKGVNLNTTKTKWNAVVRLNGKNIWFGTFINKLDAIKARIKGEIKLFGKYANYTLIEQVCEDYGIDKEKIYV